MTPTCSEIWLLHSITEMESKYLWDGETSNGESGHDVTLEHTQLVLRHPVENGEDVSEAYKPPLLARVALEMSHGIVSKECLPHCIFDLWSEAGSGRNSHAVNQGPVLGWYSIGGNGSTLSQIIGAKSSSMCSIRLVWMTHFRSLQTIKIQPVRLNSCGLLLNRFNSMTVELPIPRRISVSGLTWVTQHLKPTENACPRNAGPRPTSSTKQLLHSRNIKIQTIEKRHEASYRSTAAIQEYDPTPKL